MMVSTERRAVADISPILSIDRALEMDRMSSHLIRLRSERPPSDGVTATWERICLARELSGRTTARPAGPRLNASRERMSA